VSNIEHKILAFEKRNKAWIIFINNSGSLDYLRAKIAAATKKQFMKL
jgi:hypothetical protein